MMSFFSVTFDLVPPRTYDGLSVDLLLLPLALLTAACLDLDFDRVVEAADVLRVPLFALFFSE